MNKRLSVITLILVVMIVSLSACGENKSRITSETKVKDHSSVSTPKDSNEKIAKGNIPAVKIQQNGDNTAVIIEDNIVQKFVDITKSDKDAEFLMEFEGKEKKEESKNVLSLSFKLQNDDEPFALFHNFINQKVYTTHHKDVLSFSVKDSQATWLLNGITFPLEGVEKLSIWLISGNGKPIGEPYKMNMADVEMKSDAGTGSEQDATKPDDTEEPTTLDYQGIYQSTDYTGKKYKIAVEKNKLTVNDRYVAEFTKEDVIRTYWKGIITDTKTGEKKEADFQLQQLKEDGRYQMFLGLSVWFNEEQLLVEYAKRN